MLRLFLLLTAFVATLLGGVPLAAQVTIGFHSREFGGTFPHAFVSYEGTLSDGTPVPKGGFGFTARRLSPAILMGSVDGKLEMLGGSILDRGTRHFTITVDDAAYGRMLAVMEDWRDRPGRSYNLERANCIHFVMDIARAVGLTTNAETQFIKRPHGFTEELKTLNPGVETGAAAD